MFTSTLECEAKVGKKEELINRVATGVLPILRSQHGFVNIIVLSDDAHPSLVWKSKEDAQQYHRERNQQIVKMTRPLITGPPVVENFTVEITTSREIAASRVLDRARYALPRAGRATRFCGSGKARFRIALRGLLDLRVSDEGQR